MPNTTYLSLPYPSLSSAPNVPQDMQNLAAGVDNVIAGPVICTSSTRPATRDGAMIYETDTKRYLAYSTTAASWVVIGSNELLYARRTATLNVPSTTLVVDPVLAVSVQANASYQVTCVLAYGGTTAGDIRILFRTPTSGTFQGMGTTLVGGAVSQSELQSLPYGGNASEQWGCLGSGTQYGRVEGILITAGTAGTFQVEAAQNASNATPSTVLGGSYLMLKRVA